MARAQQEPFPLVEVDWADSMTSSGWVFGRELDHALVSIRSIGRLIYEDSEKVVLALSIDRDVVKHHQSNSRATIPRGMIIRMVTLRRVVLRTRRPGRRKK